MSTALPLAELMQNIRCEFDRMATACEAVGEVAGRTAAGSLRESDRRQIMIALQGLDGLAQSLRDFARLTSVMDSASLDAVWVSHEPIRRHLTLVSLADRLLGQQPAAPVCDGEAELFL